MASLPSASIPLRTSSKRPADIQSLEAEREKIKVARKSSNTKLKESRDWTSDWHSESAEICRLDAEYESVDAELAWLKFKSARAGTDADDASIWSQWTAEPDFEKHTSKEEAYLSERRVHLHQAEKLKGDFGHEAAIKRSWISNFISGKTGLGLGDRAGKRDDSAQSNLPRELVKLYNAAHPDERRREEWWCPVQAKYLDKHAFKAAHIFPVSFGKDNMGALFGGDKSGELMTPRNVMLMSTVIESRYDNALLTIVPDVNDIKDADVMAAWHKLRPKKYKVRVMQPDHPDMIDFIPNTNDTFASLDGKPLVWKNDIRPRARYLYFHKWTCVRRLARSNGPTKNSIMRQEFGEQYWGTMGRYFKRSMIVAAAEDMGAEYQELHEKMFDLMKEPTIEEKDFTLVQAANAVEVERCGGNDILAEEEAAATDDDDE
ncbi:hypothetical protein LTR85_006192 [Meristemomyces frigidus]|nr:hypothetical protein LTR85_006192 [Meristemomyces frigidus]